jgi:hypothetical protein
MWEREKRCFGRGVSSVLVPRDNDAGDLVVHGVLTDVVRLLVDPVESLDHHLADARADAEPDRCPDDQDVGGLDLVEDLRPFIAFAHVGHHAERDLVVDYPHDLGLDVEIVEMPDHDVHQGLGVGDFRGLLQRAVEEHGFQLHGLSLGCWDLRGSLLTRSGRYAALF